MHHEAHTQQNDSVAILDVIILHQKLGIQLEHYLLWIQKKLYDLHGWIEQQIMVNIWKLNDLDM
jgi:hypothetical protein